VRVKHPGTVATLLLTFAAVACGGESSGDAPAETPSPLFFPKRLTETAPATFRAHFETSEGLVVIEERVLR
jgi:hypothetical protein